MSAPCKNKQLMRKTAKHPRGVISAKKCAHGKRLQKIPAVKAWSQAMKEIMGFKKGEFQKIPKVGTVKYKAIKKRMNEIMNGGNASATVCKKKVVTVCSKVPTRRSARLAAKK